MVVGVVNGPVHVRLLVSLEQGRCHLVRRRRDLGSQIDKVVVVPSSDFAVGMALFVRLLFGAWFLLRDLFSTCEGELDLPNPSPSNQLTLWGLVVPTARPVNGRMVIRCASIRGSSSSRESRRNSVGSRGDSYRRGVRVRGFDRGRRDKSSSDKRTGVFARSSCSLSRKVRVGCNGDDLRRADTESGVPCLLPVSSVPCSSCIVLFCAFSQSARLESTGLQGRWRVSRMASCRSSCSAGEAEFCLVRIIPECPINVTPTD